MTHPMPETLARLRRLKAGLAEAYAAGYRAAVGDRSNQRPGPWPQDGTRGPKPYGWWPDEESTLRRIETLMMQGSEPEEIARLLNVEGHRTRSESPWTASAVRSVMERGRHGPHD